MHSALAMRAERWMQGKQEWVQEGIEQGMEKGIHKGGAGLLTRLLERRFGALPDWARDRIRDGDAAAIEEWGLRVLDAKALEDVFG